MKLLFIRHGEPNYEKDCLTENGLVQAAHLAKRLERENITAAFHSPMGRAAETAHICIDGTSSTSRCMTKTCPRTSPCGISCPPTGLPTRCFSTAAAILSRRS